MIVVTDYYWIVVIWCWRNLPMHHSSIPFLFCWLYCSINNKPSETNFFNLWRNDRIMLDNVTRKDVDNLRRSLEELTTVIDGLAWKIGSSTEEPAANCRSKCSGFTGQTSRHHGKDLICLLSSSEGDWDQYLDDDELETAGNMRWTSARSTSTSSLQLR